MSEEVSESSNTYFDKVIYINLDKRTDRREEIETQLNNFGFVYERFSAIPTPGFGIVGCGYSHLAVLKMARDNQWKNVLIFEDDFIFQVSKEVLVENLNKLYDENIEFDVCFLAYCIRESEDIPGHTFIKRTLFSQTASAYIVNQHYYNTLIELYEDAIPKLEQTGFHWEYANDIVWRGLQQRDRWIYFTTRMGRQSDGFSDNANSYQNHNC